VLVSVRRNVGLRHVRRAPMSAQAYMLNAPGQRWKCSCDLSPQRARSKHDQGWHLGAYVFRTLSATRAV